MKHTFCYIDGKIVRSDKISISAYDIGLVRGYAVHESITTQNGKLFYIKKHLKRFRNSAKMLDLTIPLPDKKIIEILETLKKKNGFARTNFRIVLTGGKIVGGLGYDKTKPTFLILTDEWHGLPKNLYENGAKLITSEFLRFIPEAKTTNYIQAVKLQPKRLKEKATEILYIANDKVLECSTSNIFMIKNEILVTPKTNVLLGITTLAVIDAVKKYFKIEIRDIAFDELLKADEVFITASFKDVLPIVKIDEKTIGNGNVGLQTQKIIKLFKELTENYK